MGLGFYYSSYANNPGQRYIQPESFWNGDHLIIPGQSNEKLLIKKDSTDNIRTTKLNHRIICDVREDGGEKFLVTSTDGTEYTFDQPKYVSDKASPSENIRALMRVSKVKDRFGNYVNYNYDTNGKLKTISSSDGRLITFSWKTYLSGDKNYYFINSITVGTGKTARVWNYEYVSGGGHYTHKWRLKKVIRPDDKFWEYGSVERVFSPLLRDGEPGTDTKIIGYCDIRENMVNDKTVFNVSDPYGNSATFTFKPTYHGRSNFLHNLSNTGYRNLLGGGPNIKFYRNVDCSVNWALHKKEVKVNGSADQKWLYDYSQNAGGYVGDDGKNIGTLAVKLDSKNLPSTITEAQSRNHKTLTITKPDNSKEIHYINRDFSSFKEGRTVAVDYFDTDGITLLKREEFSFSLGDFIGSSGITRENIKPIHNRVRLTGQKTITYSGSEATSYDNKFSKFNDYGLFTINGETFTDSSNNTRSRYTKKAYDHDTDKWILNQPTTTHLSSTNSNYSTPIQTTTYYDKDHKILQNQFMPYEIKYFNVWQKRIAAYQSDGNINKIEFNTLLKKANGTKSTKYSYQTFSKYYRGQAQKMTMPNRYNDLNKDARSMSRVVDDNGWVTYISDFNNHGESYGYDDIGDLVYVDPDNSNWSDTYISWSYNGGTSANQPVRKIKRCTLNAVKNGCSDEEKFTTTTTYDSLLRPMLAATSDGTNTVYQNYSFDANHQPTFKSFVSKSDNETLGTHITYDGLKRSTSVVFDNGGKISTSYLSDNKVQIVDAKNNITTTTYMAYGQPVYKAATYIDSPEDVNTEIDIDLYGNITSITQSGNRGDDKVSQTEYRAYNSQKRLCQIKRNDVGTTVFKRFTNGQIDWQAQGIKGASNTKCSATAQASQKVKWTYDNIGNQHEIKYGDKTPKRTYTLDNTGNITKIKGDGYTQNYTYNDQDLLTAESLTVGNKELTLHYGFDSLGNLKSLIYPDMQKAVEFKPNGFGQATKAIRKNTDDTTDTFVKSGVSYYPNGMINTFIYGNNIVHKTTLNSRKIPEKIRDYAAKTNYVDLSYGYDNNLNITSIHNNNSHDGGLYSLCELTYDNLDRLTSTTQGIFNGGTCTNGPAGIGSSNLSYDSFGNILTYNNDSLIDGQRLTYTYDATTNRLNGVKDKGNFAHNYDFTLATSKYTSGYDNRGNVINNGKRKFKYNLANQMTSSGLNSYLYDGYNRRIKLTKANGNVEYSMYSQSGKLLYRETPNGGINYIFLGSKLVAKEGAGVIPPQEANNETSIANYKPFGDIIETPRDGVGYTGHKFDTDLGLSYMQARYYDPVIGRFYSNDLVGYTAANPVMSFNRYMYVNNNPYKYTDPDGEFLAGLLIGIAIEVAIQAYTGELGLNASSLGKIAASGAAGLVGAGIASGAMKLASVAKLGKTAQVATNLGADASASVAGSLITGGTITAGGIAADVVGGKIGGAIVGAAAKKLPASASNITSQMKPAGSPNSRIGNRQLRRQANKQINATKAARGASGATAGSGVGGKAASCVQQGSC